MLKMLKSLSSVSKKRFLKSGGVKSNYENMIKNNDGILSHHVGENKGTCFLGWIKGAINRCSVI